MLFTDRQSAVLDRRALQTHVTQLACQVSKQHRKRKNRRKREINTNKTGVEGQRSETRRQIKKRRGGIPKREKREMDAIQAGILCKTPLRANHCQSDHTISTQTKLKENPYKGLRSTRRLLGGGGQELETRDQEIFTFKCRRSIFS